jgi:hydrogenase expression/formation protein HypC
MCLGIPGKIVHIQEDLKTGATLASVDFQGSRVEVGLNLVPEAKLGDWVLVHAGFALTVLDAEEAAETWRWLDKMELDSELSRAGAAEPAEPKGRP